MSEIYGPYQGTADNSYFACPCNQPLCFFNQFGDLERVVIRHGNRVSWARAGG
jgi:hypothetical protein